MGNLTNMLIIIMSINVVLFLAQASASEIDNDVNADLFDCDNSLLAQLGNEGCKANNYTMKQDYLNSSTLPSALPSVDASSGSIFVDVFNAIKNWIGDVTGIRFIYDMLTAPYQVLIRAGLPDFVSFAIGSLWYAINFFVIVAWLKGGDA